MQHVDALINEVRLLNNRLIQVASELHANAGVPPSQRAVLEYLHAAGPTTVPMIARARNVSRQHIQTIVNGAQERDLVAQQPNPAHQRSPLIALTNHGREIIDQIFSREQRHMIDHLDGMDDAEVLGATQTLTNFRNRL